VLVWGFDAGLGHRKLQFSGFGFNALPVLRE
jgi:hypothetical protein